MVLGFARFACGPAVGSALEYVLSWGYISRKVFVTCSIFQGMEGAACWTGGALGREGVRRGGAKEEARPGCVFARFWFVCCVSLLRLRARQQGATLPARVGRVCGTDFVVGRYEERRGHQDTARWWDVLLLASRAVKALF